MFKRKIQYEVVPESQHTDFSDRYEKKGSPSNSVILTAATAATASLATYAVTSYKNPTIPEAVVNPTSIPPTIEPIIEPLNVLAHTPSIPVSMTPDVIQTGFIADTSLDMLANVLDPVLQILMAVSFPIASVIMIGACFLFMVGNSEKAWSTIFNAGLGYVLIQMSPLFLEILRSIGKAV